MGEVCQTVTSSWGTGGGNVPFVQQAIPLNTMTMQGRPSDEGRMGSGIGEPTDPCPTITKAHSHAVAYSIRKDAKANTFSATPLEVSTCVGSLVPSVQSHHAQTFVAHSVAFEPGIAKREGNPSRFVEEMSPTLRSDMGDNQVAVATQPLVLEDQGGSVINTSQTGIVGTLRRESHGHEPSVLSFNHAQQSMMVGDEIASPLMQRDFKDPQTVLAPTLTASNDPSRSPQSTEVTNQVAAVYATTMAVRRLTPVECERLQGFPDNYTTIPWRKKPESPDGPRYKALGNSWAVPVVAWIGKRINDAVA